MKKVELDIIAMHNSVGQEANFVLILGETNGNRRLQIVIGAFEAQAIVIAMEGMSSLRPFTHDLFKNTMEAFSIDLTEVFIDKLEEGIYFSKLYCRQDPDIESEIDSRTSDAIALAVRFSCPIYTTEDIMKQAGVEMEEESHPAPTKSPSKKKSLVDLSLEELEAQLKEVLANEEYEQAARLRDLIEARRSQDS